MTINEKIQKQLEKLAEGESAKIVLTATGCSPAYIRNCIATSPHGNFSVKAIKGTNKLEVTKKEQKGIQFQTIEVLEPSEEPDISIGLIGDEDDFSGL